MAFQNPGIEGNLHQRQLYSSAPKERQMAIESEYVTIYGEAPSGAHVAEPRWTIWKETKDASGHIEVEYAQNGSNTLYWIYHSIAFNPPYDPSGRPYFMELDNNIVFDGMGAGLPVANIAVYDANDTTHTITLLHDPYHKFTVQGSVLVLAEGVQLADIAYPIKLQARDADGNTYSQTFAIYVRNSGGSTPGEYIGEVNEFKEEEIIATVTDEILSYTVPNSREVRLRDIDVFGSNRGSFSVHINTEVVADKDTYYTVYETNFDFENYILRSGDTISVLAKNKGVNLGRFNARMRGYQYAV